MIHPGEILLEEFLVPMEISQNALARASRVPPRRINEIILGKRELRGRRMTGVIEPTWWCLASSPYLLISCDLSIRHPGSRYSDQTCTHAPFVAR